MHGSIEAPAGLAHYHTLYKYIYVCTPTTYPPLTQAR
jgi:hypothetical protein